MEILFVFSILLYWLARGCLEGFVWSNPVRRKSNPIICGSISDGRGILDYHAWRLLEGIGIAGAIISGVFINNLYCFAFLLSGSWLLGNFVYERVLNYVVYGRLFPVKPDFVLMWFNIKRSLIVEFVLLFIGLVLLTLGFRL